ncbi:MULTISPECIES: TIGR01620 family protein [Shewanella]|uniref:TIGR01620 family protein n=1 Tax=Shewanella metallivivens TaxID=2872342 RepID=A0ABT5TKL0_9GAMM|nr:TIGR01620 family protein [Shewanella metallivivens]MDD8059143.1 TIGR01620 family protein [Shewanella metallivivens]
MNQANSASGLKKSQVFDDADLIGDSETHQSAEAIKPTQSFNEVEFVCEQTLAELPESISDSIASGKPKGWSKLAVLSLISVGLLTIVQTAVGLMESFNQSPWLFGFYATVLSIVSLWAGVGVINEWRKLANLKKVADHQARAERLSQSMQMGEANKFIAPILAKYPNTEAKQQYIQASNKEHNDAEIVMLFDKMVLSERDTLAKKTVNRFAAESALLLAASPLAALDMAIILWRNQKMINQVAAIYAVELGYWSRIKLIRSIIVNVIYAGSTEVITDLGTQLLSVEMTGKLSTRIAQGLGGGLLTARLGYQAMNLCRPIAFTSNNKPKLTQVHQHLLGELTQFTSSIMASKKVKPEDKVKR